MFVKLKTSVPDLACETIIPEGTPGVVRRTLRGRLFFHSRTASVSAFVSEADFEYLGTLSVPPAQDPPRRLMAVGDVVCPPSPESDTPAWVRTPDPDPEAHPQEAPDATLHLGAGLASCGVALGAGLAGLMQFWALPLEVVFVPSLLLALILLLTL